MANESAEQWKEAVFAHVAECRRGLAEDRADLSALEPMVRSYCQAVSRLPREEGREHARHLEALMREITSLGDGLKEAREAVRAELAGLGKLKQANVAYHRTDAIGLIRRPKSEED